MFKVVNLMAVIEVRGIAKTLFGKKEVAPRRVYHGISKLVKTEEVESTIEEYEQMALEDVQKQIKEGRNYVQDEYWATCKTYKMIEIKEVKVIKNSFVKDLEKMSYDELRKIVNVKELLMIEEYYKKSFR